MLAVVYSIESKGKKGIPYIYIIQDWITFKLKSSKRVSYLDVWNKSLQILKDKGKKGIQVIYVTN